MHASATCSTNQDFEKPQSGKHVARTVVGKELAKIVWHMLSKGEEYKGCKGRMTRITTQNYWPQPIPCPTTGGSPGA